MRAIIRGLAERFKEPSSWAGLAGIVASVAGVTLDPGLIQSITLIAAGACGVVAVVMRG